MVTKFGRDGGMAQLNFLQRVEGKGELDTWNEESMGLIKKQRWGESRISDFTPTTPKLDE